MNIVDDAPIGDANLRPEIALSWRRSLMSGLDPGSAVDRPTVAEVDRRSRLLVAATPVLDQIAGELAGTTFCVVLADRDAWIVDRRFGEARLESSMDGAGVVPGCQFLEQRTGTNSIATAFELRRGISVLGEEHFIESFKKFSCYGHPILNPVTRRLEGVLDITCPAEHASPLPAPYLVRAARDIEARLLEGAHEAERRPLAAYQAAASRQARPVLMLGGDVVLANAAAMELLEAADQAVLRGIALDSPPGRRMERSLRLASGQPVGVTFERIPGAGGVLFEFRAGSSHSPHAKPPPHSTRRPGTTPGDRWCVHSIVCVRAVHCQTGEKRAAPRQWRSSTPSTVR
jgi:transcriptional regulator of acetoin/glycerol metabolism